MALPALIQAAIDRIRAANGNAYNASTNPGGLAQGGHRQNFVPDLNAVADLGEYVADRADDAVEAAALTAEDASNTALDRIATAQDRTNAATSAANAAASAAGVNLPAVTVGDANKVLSVKTDGSGYEPQTPREPTVATQAEAESGSNNTKMMTPLRVSQAIAALGANVTYEVITASGTFTKATDDIGYVIECIGPGGSGGPGGSTYQAGGMPGTISSDFFAASQVGSTESVVIGAGGVSSSGLVGTPGGTTSFGSLLSAAGGSGGASNTSSMAYAYNEQTNVTQVATNISALTYQLTTRKSVSSGNMTLSYSGVTIDMPTHGACCYSGTMYTPPLSNGYGRGGLTAGAAGSAPGGGGAAGNTGACGSGARGEVRIWRFKK